MSESRLPAVDIGRLVKAAKARQLIRDGKLREANALLNEIDSRTHTASVIDFGARRALTTPRI